MVGFFLVFTYETWYYFDIYRVRLVGLGGAYEDITGFIW